MGQWISSKEFAKSFNTNKKSLEKACFRANQRGKKICSIKSIIINFNYARGIGGYAGKILQIWNTPLSQEQVEALEKGYPIKYVLEEMGEVAQPNVMESMDSKTLDCKGIDNEKTSQNIQGKALHTRGIDCASKHYCGTTSSSNSSLYRNDLSNGGITIWHNLTSSQKAQAKQRERILLDYESAKASGIRVADFLTLKNSEDSTLKLTQGKLFDWQRKYKAQGLSGLSDKRGVAKTGTTSLPKWAQEEVVKMWRVMGSGYLNRMQLWRELHMIAPMYLKNQKSLVCEGMESVRADKGIDCHETLRVSRNDEVKNYSYKKFLQCEIPPLFSLNTLNRFLDSYLKANSLEYTLITYGTDKTDSYKEPAYGMQRDLYTLPNQLWQIDSSPLDAIVLDRDGKQIRPSILSIIDVYSGRSVAYLSETSDSNAVVRLMWKAFESMGKPEAIQFDNGKDYLSNKVQGLVDGLGIKFVRSAAYKGKAKAVVERRFRTIQGSYITALSSYIGRNVSERSAREQQTPKRERKSKDALGNPLKTQQKHIITFEAAQFLLDEAVEFWNIDRVSRKWSKAQGRSPMDLWSEANFQRINVDYTQFLLYAEEGKARVMGKNCIEMRPYSYVPTQYIKAGSKVLVRVNINASNEAFIFSEKGEFLCLAYDRKANPLTQEQLKTISKEYKSAIKRIRELQKDATHSEFIRRNARLEAEALKHKMDSALLNGIGESSEGRKTLKTQAKEAIHNAQVERNQEDNWELENPLQVENKTDNTDDWDLLQKLAQ
ncbi:integrase catalytic domain-containing protein [Helicobacter rodentium]|uniref:integrase catalytic domain-containing protein n=1 Tax=Helicobacter rodentium TaxID=59617 RepID=UPI00262A0FB8|nr:transposase family protein [Helicobacter rodentium]